MEHIRDKNLWKATELAYKYMLKEKNFDKAVTYYSNKYGIDYDVLSHEVKKKQKSERKNPYRKRKTVREEYKPECVKINTATQYKDIIKGLKEVGTKAHEQGNEELADLMRKTILAIAEMVKVIGLSR